MNRHRLRKKLPLLATLAVLALAISAYVLGLAWIQSRIYAFYDFADLIQPRLIDVTIAGWLLFVFSSIGSFLNVVAWRMPRGEGIGGHSHCPRCANPLQARDNVPILGWISLGGRCRFCALPISRRYPIIEALVGLSLTVIGISELYSLALPAQYVHGHDGPLWSPQVSPELLGILTYHTAAVACLWAMTLIRIDATRLPNRMLVFAAAAVVLPMLAFPTVMVVPWQARRPIPWSPEGLYVDSVMRVATAVVAAALIGRILARGLCPSANLKLDPLGRGSARLLDLIAMLSVPAIVIGWQSMPALVISAALLTFAVRPLLNWIPINDGPTGQVARRGVFEAFAFALPITLTLHLTFWRVLWRLPLWPSDQSSSNVILYASLIVLALPLVLRERIEIEASDSLAGNSLDDDAPRDTEDEETIPIASTDELPNDHGDREPDDRNHRGNDTPSA